MVRDIVRLVRTLPWSLRLSTVVVTTVDFVSQDGEVGL